MHTTVTTRRRVLRVIARLNVGGPAIQVQNLSRRLVPRGYDTVLLHGELAPGEESMAYLSRALNVEPVRLPGLRRGLGLHDLRALWRMLGYLRNFRPDVLHTHTAKAGAIGRLAVILAPAWRPKVVLHTFHGHVFVGEFGPVVSRCLVMVERFLARYATRVIGVSQEIADDLIELGVAPASKVEVVHLGFDLAPFSEQDEVRELVRARMRDELGIPAEARVVTIVARVVRVKRVDRFLEMARELLDLEDVHFLVAGDGDRRADLQASDDAQAIGDRLHWSGFLQDVPSVCFASDVVVLTSDNEGTPVCLIEAQAAAVPVVTTEVGGVRTVVRNGESGLITSSDARELAAATRRLLGDARLRADFGAAGRAHATAEFSVERLVDDIDDLYSRLLDEHPSNQTAIH